MYGFSLDRTHSVYGNSLDIHRYSNALQCGLGPIILYLYLYSYLHLYLYLYLGLSVWWPAGVLARREGAFPVSLAWKVKNDPSIDSHPHKVRPQYLAALI